MPLSTQAKLLRALQNQEVTRVGSVTPRKVDVRVIAATNRDVQDLIAQKQFREDLYYRLAMVELRTPALADRREDLPLARKVSAGPVRHAIQQGHPRADAARPDRAGAAFLAGQYSRTGKRAGPRLHDGHRRHDRCRGSACFAAPSRAYGGRGRGEFARNRATGDSAGRLSTSTRKGCWPMRWSAPAAINRKPPECCASVATACATKWRSTICASAPRVL